MLPPARRCGHSWAIAMRSTPLPSVPMASPWRRPAATIPSGSGTLPTGELLRTLGPQKAHVLALDFSPDATTLATGSGTGAAAPPIPFHSSRSAELKFFDPHTGRETYSSPAFFSSITALAFRPDGEVLAVAFISADKASDIDFLETRSHRLRRHFLAHRGFIHSIAFSPDGAWLVSVGSDQAIRAWH